MNILISCVGTRGGYVADFFRPHLEATDRIIGTANTPWTPGFQSCDAAFVLPGVDDDDYVPAVLQLCERERIDAVVCVEDYDVCRLARARAEFLDRGIIPLFPSAEITELASDKYRMFKFLTDHGIATPRTAVSLAEASGFRYPMYVKPRRGHGSRHLFLARNERELAVFFDYAPDMIIQEAAPGQEINIQLCTDLDGRPIGICVLRKQHMRHGETSQAETFRDPAVIDFGLHLGEVLRATGPMDVDVMQQGDSLVVLEANTRFGGGYPVSHLAGADFPKLLLELVKYGKAVEPNFAFAAGVVMMKGLKIMGGDAARFFWDELRIHDAKDR
jgi:carbamoyl-phosphate synthase large subunit